MTLPGLRVPLDSYVLGINGTFKNNLFHYDVNKLMYSVGLFVVTYDRGTHEVRQRGTAVGIRRGAATGLGRGGGTSPNTTHCVLGILPPVMVADQPPFRPSSLRAARARPSRGVHATNARWSFGRCTSACAASSRSRCAATKSTLPAWRRTRQEITRCDEPTSLCWRMFTKYTSVGCRCEWLTTAQPLPEEGR